MKILKCVLCAAILLVSMNSLAGSWVQASNGYVPRGAWAIGYEEDGTPLYLCRANFHGLQPGKVRRDFRGCNISYAGKEITIHNYSVYLNRPVNRPVIVRPAQRFVDDGYNDDM